MQPPSGNNNNCWSVTHAGFHRIQGLEKGSLMPHSCSFFSTIMHLAIFFIAFPNSWHFVSKNNKTKSKNCKGKINDFVWRETSLNAHLVDSDVQLIHMVCRIPHKQGEKSCTPCLNYGKSQVVIQLPGYSCSCKIPFPVKIFCIFPNPIPYFGQILDPKTLRIYVNSVNEFWWLFSQWQLKFWKQLPIMWWCSMCTKSIMFLKISTKKSPRTFLHTPLLITPKYNN